MSNWKKITKANKEFHDLFVDYYDDKHAKDIFFDENQRRIKKNLNEIAEISGNDLMIDLGCGTGNLLRLAKDIYNKVWGVDVSEKSLEKAKKYTLNLVCSDIASVPLDSELANVVTAYSVLHHLYDPIHFFREAFRLLKHGGTLYVDNDPNVFSEIYKNVMMNLARSRNLLSYCKRVLFHLKNKKTLEKGAKVDNLTNLSPAEKIIRDNRQLYDDSEYHHDFTGREGLNIYDIRKCLRNIGFVNIKITMQTFFCKEGRVKVYPLNLFSILKGTHFAITCQKK